MTLRRTTAVVIGLALASVTAACSGADPQDPPQPLAETTTPRSPSTSPAPSPEEVASEAALAAQQAFVDLDVRSSTDPARDWTAEYTELLAEPQPGPTSRRPP